MSLHEEERDAQGERPAMAEAGVGVVPRKPGSSKDCQLPAEAARKEPSREHSPADTRNFKSPEL